MQKYVPLFEEVEREFPTEFTDNDLYNTNYILVVSALMDKDLVAELKQNGMSALEVIPKKIELLVYTPDMDKVQHPMNLPYYPGELFRLLTKELSTFNGSWGNWLKLVDSKNKHCRVRDLDEVPNFELDDFKYLKRGDPKVTGMLCLWWM